MTDSLDQSEFIGAWQRESLMIEKGEAFEDSNVLWLYAGNYFADIRWPKPGESRVKPSAFAGRALWNAPSMQFNHEIDLTKELDKDVGILSFSEGKLIEVGQVTIEGKIIRFEETWAQLCKATQEKCLVVQKCENAAQGYIIRIGGFVIAMEESNKLFSAAAWKYEKENWSLLFGLGDVASLCTLRLSLPTFAHETELPPGWQIKN